jgi:hypothetical protein
MIAPVGFHIILVLHTSQLPWYIEMQFVPSAHTLTNTIERRSLHVHAHLP